MFPERITLEGVLYTALFGFVFGFGFHVCGVFVARLFRAKATTP